jgi:hypothetical protein
MSFWTDRSAFLCFTRCKRIQQPVLAGHAPHGDAVRKGRRVTYTYSHIKQVVNKFFENEAKIKREAPDAFVAGMFSALC